MLLHGFPSSSHQYRNLIPALSDDVFTSSLRTVRDSAIRICRIRGSSTTPSTRRARSLSPSSRKWGSTRFGLYMQDYGGPVGFRIVTRRPGMAGVADHSKHQRLRGRLYRGLGWTPQRVLEKLQPPEAEKPLEAFLEPATIRQIYLHEGHKQSRSFISPDNWNMDSSFLTRPNARRIQLDLFYDYRTNVQLYPEWQAFLKKTATEDNHLLGPGRPLLHPGGRPDPDLRDLPTDGAASPRLRPFRG